MQEKEGEKLSLHKKHAQKAQNYEIKFNSILGLFPDICLPLSWNTKFSNPHVTQNFMQFKYYFLKKYVH